MEKRRSQVLPFTLAEVLVLLFFVLALALANETRRRGNAERSRAEAGETERILETLGEGSATRIVELLSSGESEFPEEFSELVRSLESGNKTRDAILQHLVEAGSDSARLAAATETELVDSLLSRQEALETENETLQVVAELSPGERDVLRTMADSIVRLARQSDDLRGQLAFLRDRIGNGLDHPPCWPDASGRPEYAFEATMHTDYVDVRGIWPSHRDDDVARTPGMPEMAGRGLSLAAFAQRARPIFDWSQAQDPICRHFTVIVDSVAGSKEAYKRSRAMVEGYFYIVLAN